MVIGKMVMIDLNIQTQQDENSLVMAASNGDLEAFNQLVLTYQDMVYNHAYAMVGDAAAAEDITQVSFLKSYRGLSGFRGGSFRNWLMKIATNTAYDTLRHRQRYPAIPLFIEDENGEDVETPPWIADNGMSVQEMVEQRQLAENLQSLISQLPEKYRIVLILVDVDQFDYVEAAAALRIPVGTLKSRLVRARLKMKEKLTQVLPHRGDTFPSPTNYAL